MKVGLTSKTLSQIELTTLTKWTVRPRLMAVPGVANVAIWGQRDRQLQVLVDPERLQAHNVTLDEVIDRHARRDRGRRPAGSSTRRTSGWRSRTCRRSAVRRTSRRCRSCTATARRCASATSPRSPRASPPPIGDAVIDTGAGLMLIVEKQPGANTLEVTRGVEAALEALRAGHARRRGRHSRIFRPATFIEMSLRNLGLVDADRRRARHRRPDRVPVRLAQRAHHHHRDAAVAHGHRVDACAPAAARSTRWRSPA